MRALSGIGPAAIFFADLVCAMLPIARISRESITGKRRFCIRVSSGCADELSHKQVQRSKTVVSINLIGAASQTPSANLFILNDATNGGRIPLRPRLRMSPAVNLPEHLWWSPPWREHETSCAVWLSSADRLLFVAVLARTAVPADCFLPSRPPFDFLGVDYC